MGADSGNRPKWTTEPISASPEDKFYEEIRNFWKKIVINAFVMRGSKPMTIEKLPDRYPEAQRNDNGQIALKYRQPGNILLQGNPSGKEYVAVTQANICLAWVDPADIDFILAKKDGCCGGKRQSFFLANEADVRRWTNKGGQ